MTRMGTHIGLHQDSLYHAVLKLAATILFLKGDVKPMK